MRIEKVRERENKGLLKNGGISEQGAEGRKETQRRKKEKNVSMLMMSSIMHSVLIDITGYS